jgi:hypothetical protein
MLSDIMSPNAFSRRASSMRFSMAMNAPPSGEGFVGGPDQMHFPVQVPVVQDQAHRDDIRRGERVHEEDARGDSHAVGQADGGDGLPAIGATTGRS